MNGWIQTCIMGASIAGAVVVLIWQGGAFVNKIGMRFDILDKRMDGLDQRMDKFESRMDKFESRMDRFERSLNRLAHDITKIKVKLRRE